VISFDLVLRMILAPAVAAALILGLLWSLYSHAARKSGPGIAWAAPLAVATAAALGYALLEGWPAYPKESWQWLAWITVAGGVLGIVESLIGGQRRGTRERPPEGSHRSRAGLWSMRIPLLAACATCLLLRVAKTSDGSFDVAHVALDVGAVAIGWFVLATAIPAHGPRVGAIVLCVVATAATPLFVFSGNARFAYLSAALCSGLGALSVACWLRPSPRALTSALTPAALLLGLLCVSAREFGYARFSPAWYGAVAIAPALALLPGSRWIPIASEPLRVIARLAVLGAVLGVAVMVAWNTYDPSPY
jgi:hypothetical protein